MIKQNIGQLYPVIALTFKRQEAPRILAHAHH